MTPSGEISHSSEPIISSTPRASIKKELPAMALMVLYVAVLMWPFTFSGQALMPDTWKSIHPWARGADVRNNNTSIYDTVLEYDPWFKYSQQCLKEGRVPHWNPWQFCGEPLYGNRLVPYFFPPFILAELAASPHKIIAWFQLFNLILSGWGMYFLLRRWKMMHVASTAGSMLWLTCGVHFLPFPLWTLGVIGFPWLLWALDGFLEKPGPKYIAVASFITGLILMVGYPILVVHLTYFTAIYFIARWWVTRRTGDHRLHWTLPLLTLLAIYILGAGISAIANYPAWIYSKQTVRQVEGFTDLAYEREKRILLTPSEEAGLDPIAAWFGERADILLPINGEGTKRAWQYGGIIVYLLAFIGILGGRCRAHQLAIIGLLFAGMIWVPQAYLFLIDWLPGWGITILQPVEVLNLIVFLLAAFGIDIILGGKYQPDKFGKILTAILSIAAIAFTYRFLRDAPVIDLPILIDKPEPDLLAYSAFHRRFLTAAIFLAVVFPIIIYIKHTIMWVRAAAVAMLLFFSMSTFWYLQPVYSQHDYMPETPFTRWISENTAVDNPAYGNRLARWAVLPLPFNPHKRAKSPFTPNIQMNYGMMDVGGYDSLIPKRFIDYCSLFEDPFIDYRALISFEAPSTIYHPRFRAMGVRWIISQGELPEESRQGLRLVYDDRISGNQTGTDNIDDFMQLWEIENPEPRAFLTRNIAWSNDPDDSPVVQAANWAAQGYNVVVVEYPEGAHRSLAYPDEDNASPDLVLNGSNVTINIDEPEKIVMDVYSPSDSWLILRDVWYPEWKAYVDGVETPICPADNAFRAVRIDAGSHTVEFRYMPSSFRTGILITLISLIIPGIFLFRERRL